MKMESKEQISNKLKNNIYVLRKSAGGLSDVWSDFDHIVDPITNLRVGYVQCTTCFAILSYKGGCTSSMKRHSCAKPKNVPKAAQDRILRACVLFCVLDLRPFEIVEGRGFINLVHELLKLGAVYGPVPAENIIPSKSTISEHMRAFVDEVMGEISPRVKEAIASKQCAFTSDMWNDIILDPTKMLQQNLTMPDPCMEKSKLQFSTEQQHSTDVQLNKIATSSKPKVKSKEDIITLLVKQEPEMRSELETINNSDGNSESPSVRSNTDIYETVTNIQIKQEPKVFKTSNESEDSHLKDTESLMDAEDDVSEDVLLNESTSLGMQDIWGCESTGKNIYHHKQCSSVNQHRCTTCNKLFAQASHLRQHSLIHRGINPYKCNICDQSFAQAAILREHMFKHEGRQPYKCAICDRGFTHAATLRQHVLFHDSKKQYRCSLCDKQFTLPLSLRQHILVHKSKRQLKCKVCGRTFSQASILRRHILKHNS